MRAEYILYKSPLNDEKIIWVLTAVPSNGHLENVIRNLWTFDRPVTQRGNIFLLFLRHQRCLSIVKKNGKEKKSYIIVFAPPKRKSIESYYYTIRPSTRGRLVNNIKFKITGSTQQNVGRRSIHSLPENSSAPRGGFGAETPPPKCQAVTCFFSNIQQ